MERATIRANACTAVGLLIEAAKRLHAAEKEFEEAKAKVYQILHEALPLKGGQS